MGVWGGERETEGGGNDSEGETTKDGVSFITKINTCLMIALKCKPSAPIVCMRSFRKNKMADCTDSHTIHIVVYLCNMWSSFRGIHTNF